MTAQANTAGLWLATLVAIVLGARPAPAQSQPADPVEGLRRALKEPVRDPAARDRSLRRWVAELRSFTDLSQALALKEWRDQDVIESVAAVDRCHRFALGRQFQQVVRDRLEHGDPLSQMVVADHLAALGVTLRADGAGAGLGRTLGPDLVRMIRSQGDPRVCQAAIRALGFINPDPDVALPALNDLLGAADASLRLAAAEALVNLVQVVAQLAVQGTNATGVQASHCDLINVSQAVVRTAGRGLGDIQPEVRRLSARAVGQSAAALGRLILEPYALDGTRNREAPSRQAGQDHAESMPLVLALRDQCPVLVRALADPDMDVRLQVLQTLEDVGNLRMRLFPRTAASAAPTAGQPSDPLEEGLHAAVVPLTAGLADPEPRVRRAVLDVLETLGPGAAEALPGLIAVLNDSDPFVRWAAARTLGKMGAVASDTVVPALVRLLTDPDLDLRLVALTALERYGPAAQAAEPVLIALAAGRDAVEVRLAALRVLVRIGHPGGEPAVAAFCAALADPDVRIRQMGAVGLGRLGPAARIAVDTLRQARSDPSLEVQHAAGDALLHILQPLGN